MPRPEQRIRGRGPAAELARALRSAREDAGLTYRAMAEIVGYSPGTLSGAASGESLPTWQVTEAYLSACGISGAEREVWRSRLESARRSSGDNSRVHAGPAEAPAAWAPASARGPLAGQKRDTRPYALAVSAELNRLWTLAGVSQARVARMSGVPLATLSDWMMGKSLPRDAVQVEQVGAALAKLASVPAAEVAFWERLLESDRAAARTGLRSEPGLGRRIAELEDPDAFGLEVHPPVTAAEAGEPDTAVLPAYVPRDHDAELAAVVTAAASGASQMAVLVGGSSTGKTRACWEAATAPGALPGWRLWHPYNPTRGEALLEGLPTVGPRTVIWLNETHLYLSGPGDVSERAAAGLRSLLEDPSRGPVLVLGTIWPEHWGALVSGGDRQARTLLADATNIAVPEAFTGPDLDRLHQAAQHDSRLAAAAHAADGQAAQFLSGAPALLARYRNAPPAARAVIEAAMDARRLGHGPALPHAFLEAAAPAYLTDAQWDTAGDDWFQQALAYAAAPCAGVAGPVTRIRPRPGPQASLADDGPTYRLADYLDQHGRRRRAAMFPPDGLWDAAARTTPGDQCALALAAHSRGLYRHAAQLAKDAAAVGHDAATASLVSWLASIAPADTRPASYVAAHVSASSPDDMVALLRALERAGADGQVTLVASRAAEHAGLGDPVAVAELLAALLEVGAREQVMLLAARTVAATPPDDLAAVAFLLDAMRNAGAVEQAGELAARAAGSIALDNPAAVAVLLDAIRNAGAVEQAGELAARAASSIALDNPAAVAVLLDAMRNAGAVEQVAQLAARAAASTTFDDPARVARLLGSLREAAAAEQVAELAGRAAAGTPLDNPGGVASLLDTLRKAGADGPVAELAARAAPDAAIDDPAGVAVLLAAMSSAGAGEQVMLLAARAAAAPPDDLAAVAFLLDAMRKAGAGKQAGELSVRLPAAGLFDAWLAERDTRYRFGREPDGAPARSWGWDDLAEPTPQELRLPQEGDELLANVQRPGPVPDNAYAHDDGGEAAEVLRSDRELLETLVEDGFADPVYASFEEELATYGHALMLGLIRSGYIFSRCREIGINLQPRPISPHVVEDLVQETVVRTLPVFKKRLMRGQWRADGGVSLRTYFIGGLLRSFANVWRAYLIDTPVVPAGLVPSEVLSLDLGLPDTMAQREAIREGLASIENQRTRAALVLTEDGYYQEEIAQILGISPRTVEGLLRRHRGTLAAQSEAKGS
jgi:transcriptional regulator with XRE-family HTH domain/DNA-directed RNA polymerase specialized sigma24 family protein